MTHHTSKTATEPPAKPKKPYPEFPLFPHATRRWAKKIKGKLHYFGPWDDPEGALNKYLAQKDDLHAGRTPRVSVAGVTVADAVDHFLTAKKHKLDAGELRLKSFGDLYNSGRAILNAFGKDRLVIDLAADDFAKLRAKLAERCGPVRLANEIQRVRSVFRYAYEAALVDAPVRFGPEFKKPARHIMRKARHANGARSYTAAEIRTMIDTAGVPLKAMILLGINCGMGNTDVAELPRSAIDLKGRMIDFPRPKTGIARSAPLWPETVKALKAALDARPKPKRPALDKLAFLTVFGEPWVRVHEPAKDTAKNRAITSNAVALQFGKLLTAAGLPRDGRGFYALRHTFRTVADAVGDRPAVDRIMGHEDAGDMRIAYVESIDPSRLKRVSDRVHAWLFPKRKRTTGKSPARK